MKSVTSTSAGFFMCPVLSCAHITFKHLLRRQAKAKFMKNNFLLLLL